MPDVLVKVDNVSKKFCRNLKRSLWYGVRDIYSELLGGKNRSHDDLRKDEFWAVKDVSFELKRGECLGLIGHNGAGKSTLLKMLNGLIKPDRGTITMRGRVGALIELGAGFNPILTGRENIYINGQVLGFTKKEIDERLDRIIEFAEIGDFIDMPVQNYSSGMKVRLGFAVASQMEPDILLIDEVLAVGDLGFQVKCFNVIQEIARKSVVILVSHSTPNIARIADKVCLMKNGLVDYYGSEIDGGISKYLVGFAGEKYIITGNETEILDLRIIHLDTSESIDNRTYLNSFDSIRLLFQIDLNSFRAGTYKIVYVFFDQTLRQFAQFVSNEFELTHEHGLRTFETKLKRLNFNSGRYSLGIAFYIKEDNKLKIFTFHKNITSINFNTEGNITNALVSIEGVQEIY